MGRATEAQRAYFNGCLIGAAVVVLVMQYWSAFMLALVILVGLGCYGGDIRPIGRGRLDRDGPVPGLVIRRGAGAAGVTDRVA